MPKGVVWTARAVAIVGALLILGWLGVIVFASLWDLFVG